MIFKLDTTDYSSIKITFTEEDYNQGLQIAIQKFCYAIASFFVDFSMKIDCDTKKAESLKKVVLECIDEDIVTMLKAGLLKSDDEELEEKLELLTERMKDEGFSESYITNVIAFVRKSGSLESGIERLKHIAQESGIGLDENS